MMQQVEGVFSFDKLRPTASPTSVLEDDPCAFMADWSWEASNTPLPPVTSQAGTTSPVCSSPLRSSSSSEGGATAMQQQNQQQNNSTSKTSRSLVETLQNCLTSLPQSTSTMSEPSPRQPPSRPAGKRRPRASRRTPTKTIETEPADFKDMVQKLTGIPVPTPPPAPAGTPVRPLPQRANPIGPQTLRSIRRLPPMGPPPMFPLSRLRPSTDTLRPCKREFDQIDSGSAPKRVMSAPIPSMLPSWCWEDNESNPPFAAMSTCSEPSSSSYSIDSQAKENLINVSAIGDEQEFNFDPLLTSWLSVDSSSTSTPFQS